ncbi:uncharacterized protein LOC133815299 [Humulus lupulus]|uniref:uncharacterized protein LOC133815299 n=1 Tax=Humulus lupulus TaxID=3486 RepID=UPI002B4174ED|nr:uncharacterized protein LOC133815299 [Humulus lupulus]
MNTSFFYAFLKKRKAENGIVSFIAEEGRLVDNFSEVVSHFVDHFRGFLGSSSSATGRIKLQSIEMGSKLSFDQQLMLRKPFSRKEICDALFGIPITKSPGPDGFGSGFFKAVWQDIGDEVCSAISHCFEQDLIKNYGRASTSPRCAIKIDLSKAYDTVYWRFQGKFKGEKGLRQGDPMSPLLFVLIMQYLTRSLQLAVLNSTFRYHPMCKSLKLLNLCFADDLLLFCKGSHSTVSIIREVLEEFGAATRLSINSEKSHIFFGGVIVTERNQIAQEIQLSEVKEIEKLCRSFLWCNSGHRSKLHIPSWQKVCLPKAYGGLSFRDGASWNRAILAKYVWAISEKPEVLWVKWINSTYLKGLNFWNYTLKSDCSWYWRKLFHQKERYSPAAILIAGG